MYAVAVYYTISNNTMSYKKYHRSAVRMGFNNFPANFPARSRTSRERAARQGTFSGTLGENLSPMRTPAKA